MCIVGRISAESHTPIHYCFVTGYAMLEVLRKYVTNIRSLSRFTLLFDINVNA